MHRWIPTLLLLLPMGACKKEPKPDPTTTTTGSTIADVTPPEIVSVDPASGSEDVDPSVVVTVTFSEPLDPASVGENALQVSADAQSVAGETVLDGAELRFTPAEDLPASAEVEVVVDAALTDLAGNPLGDVDPTGFQVLWDPSGPFVLVAGVSETVQDKKLWRIDIAGSTPVARELVTDSWNPDHDLLSVSPDGRRVLLIEGGTYEIEHRLLLGSAGGGGFQWLTTGSERGGATAWHPSGDHLAYVRGEPGGAAQLLVRWVGLGAPQEVETGPAKFEGWVGWHPHGGTELAWTGDDGHLLLGMADGLTVAEDLSGMPVLGVGYDAPNKFPRWAADGSRLAFVEDPLERCDAELQSCLQTQSLPECEPDFFACMRSAPLYTVASGSAPVRVTPDGDGVYEYEWVDADRLIWTCTSCPGGDLYLSDATGGLPSVVATGLAAGDWWVSPDGTQVAYQTENGSSELYVVDVDTGPSSARMVSPAGWHVWRPVWSPDSSAVVFSVISGDTYPASTASKVLVAAADGSTSVEVAAIQSPDIGSVGPATFAADGLHVLYAAWDYPGLPMVQVYLAPKDGTAGAPLDVGTYLPSSLQTWDPSGPGATFEL